MTRLSAMTLICAGLTVATMAGAASGQLDPTFGKGGIVITNFSNDVRPMDAALQADGKLVVVGLVNDFKVATQLTAVVRYLPNGSLDASFGRNGVATDAVTNFLNEADAVVIQSDGKIVVLERAFSADGTVDESVLARFDSAGRLDASFGTTGRVFINFPHPAFFHTQGSTLLLQPNQKILVGGAVVAPGYHSTTPTRTALARYTPTGTPDGTFGTNGVAEALAIGVPGAMAVLTDGSILAVNFSEQTAQFTATGALLPSVVGGVVTASTHPGTAAFRSDGEFLVAVRGQGPGGRHDADVSVRLLEPTGAVDPNFQPPLFDFATDAHFSSAAQAIALGPTGEIALGGSSLDAIFNADMAVARLNPNGTLDGRFANGGTKTTPFPHGGQVLAIVVQPDGKIVAIGQAFSNDTAIPTNLALVRYLTQ